MSEPTKVCSACGETLPLDDFHRRTAARDGRQSYCKTCMRKVNVRLVTARRRTDPVFRESERVRQADYRQRRAANG